jgi:mono/diheme cytochrome c family protein
MGGIMSMIKSCCGLVAMAASLLLGQADASAASAEKGKTLFIQYGCFQCHGTVGQGGNAGPKLAPDPLPYEALANFVRTTNRQMPPYREAVLPNDDLADIYAYLQSVPKTPDYKTIPLLNE